MLFLLLSISDIRYALPAKHIIEVIPNILEPKQNIQSNPEYFAGVINYYNTLLPVADLCQLHGGTPCTQRLSSRIILINYPKDDGKDETIGLLAEQVTETVIITDEEKIIHSKAGISFILLENEAQEDKIEVFDLTRMLPNNFDIFCLK